MYAGVVDLDRYPMHDLETSRGRAFLESCRAELAGEGVCTLAGFLSGSAVAEMVSIGNALSEAAWASDQSHTVYFEPPDDSFPPDDARRRLVRSAKHGIAYDLIPPEAPLRRLYESDDMTRFVAAVLGHEVLFRSADPLDACQITLFLDGEELGWHFDNSEFSVTVMYQPPDEGGHFEYVANLRSAGDPNYEGVNRVLSGDESRLRRLPAAPGTLAIFRGHDALHRVTQVGGTVPRINSVLTYGERPDMRLSDLTSKLFYGRVSPAPA